MYIFDYLLFNLLTETDDSNTSFSQCLLFLVFLFETLKYYLIMLWLLCNERKKLYFINFCHIFNIHFWHLFDGCSSPSIPGRYFSLRTFLKKRPLRRWNKEQRKRGRYPVWDKRSRTYFLNVSIRFIRKTRKKLSPGESRVGCSYLWLMMMFLYLDVFSMRYIKKV